MDQEYPKWKYHLTKAAVIIKDPDEEAALGVGWANTPAAFDPYRGARAARSDLRGCLKWVDEWPVPNLSSDHRKKIKAQLLKADAAFCMSPHDPSTVEGCMQRAFAGVAEVLFEAGIFSERLLENDIPQLVWDTAVAGGWWRFAAETQPGISSEQIGHYWVWWNESRSWRGLFQGVSAEWLARLLDVDQGPALDTERINRWIQEEGYDNQELAGKLRISARVVSSMRNNDKYHGRNAVEKLAKLMQVDAANLYLPVK